MKRNCQYRNQKTDLASISNYNCSTHVTIYFYLEQSLFCIYKVIIQLEYIYTSSSIFMHVHRFRIYSTTNNTYNASNLSKRNCQCWITRSIKSKHARKHTLHEPKLNMGVHPILRKQIRREDDLLYLQCAEAGEVDGVHSFFWPSTST